MKQRYFPPLKYRLKYLRRWWKAMREKGFKRWHITKLLKHYMTSHEIPAKKVDDA